MGCGGGVVDRLGWVGGVVLWWGWGVGWGWVLLVGLLWGLG